MHRPHFVPAPQPGQTAIQAALQQQGITIGQPPAQAVHVQQHGAPVAQTSGQQQLLQVAAAPTPASSMTPGGLMPQQSVQQLYVQQQPIVPGQATAQQLQQQLFPSLGAGSSSSSSGSSTSSGSASSWGSASVIPSRPTFQSLRAEDLIPFDAYVFLL